MSLKQNGLSWSTVDMSPAAVMERDRQIHVLGAWCAEKKAQSDIVEERTKKAVNPYKTKLLTKKMQCIRQARELMASRKSSDEKGYQWSMGYNNLVAKYTPGGPWYRFTGSSINRKLKSMDNEKNLPPATIDLLKMARQVYREMRNLGRPVPWQALAYLRAQNEDSEREFRLWISGQIQRDICADFGTHVLSARSRGKIKDKATAFFRASVGDRIFCTLTFVAAVDDRTGVAILNKFLTALRKKFDNLQFMWVAERQTNNEDFPNNIHFHLILNKRLPVRYFNGLWVLQQYNAGLRGKNKFGSPISMEEVQRRFKEGSMQKVLNPLDVKRVRNIGGLSMYLTKYITKQKKNDPFGCAVWHCSRKVSRLFTRAAVGPSAFSYMLSFNNWRVDKRTGECFPPMEPIYEAFYVMVYAHNKEGPLKFLREMEQINKWTLRESIPVTRDWLEISDEWYRSHYMKN
jgi:hypothetical protein